MPRPNPERTIGAERKVAERIIYERRVRSWSYDEMSKRMTRAGCPIQASAIYKIEKGEPPRRITVNELVALSVVFDLPIEDLAGVAA